MASRGFAPCKAPGGTWADFMEEFARSGDQCWGRECGEDARKVAGVLRQCHRRNKERLRGIRVMLRGSRVYLVREDS